MIGVDFSGVGWGDEALRAHRLWREARPTVWSIARAHSFNAERQVKLEMPVDTGRARASWGHSTAPANLGDGIWNESEPALTIIQGSNVEYIPALNAGHSRQAPAGFIDAIAVREQDAMEDDILAALLELWK